MASNIETERTENISSDSKEILTDEQSTEKVVSNNLSSTQENTNYEEILSTTSNRSTGQTAIGAKIIKKLEKIGI